MDQADAAGNQKVSQEEDEADRAGTRTIWGSSRVWLLGYFGCPDTYNKLGRSRRAPTQFCRRSWHPSATLHPNPSHSTAWLYTLHHSLNLGLAGCIKQQWYHHTVVHRVNCFPSHLERDWTMSKTTMAFRMLDVLNRASTHPLLTGWS